MVSINRTGMDHHLVASRNFPDHQSQIVWLPDFAVSIAQDATHPFA
jgi:hypothetical protein